MKNNVLKGLLIIVCLCGIYYVNKSTQIVLTDLALDNVEALASGEGNGNYRCYDYGDIDCHGYKVAKKVEGLSLDIE